MESLLRLTRRLLTESAAFGYAVELAGMLESATSKMFGSTAQEKVPDSKKRKASSMSSPPAEGTGFETAVSPPEAEARMSPITQETATLPPQVSSSSAPITAEPTAPAPLTIQ